MSASQPDPNEREAIVRLLSELGRACNADVGAGRAFLLLGFVSATARLAASDIEAGTTVERLHAHADWLAERVAELERP